MHYLSIKCFCIELYNSICYITFDKELFPRFKFLKIVPPCIFYISLIFFFKKSFFQTSKAPFFEALLFTRCSLLVEIHSLFVTRCKITRYLLQNLLVTRCKESLVTRCRSWSLQKITRCSLQNSLVTRCRSCLLQKIIRYLSQKLLVAKNHSLLVAEVARC